MEPCHVFKKEKLQWAHLHCSKNFYRKQTNSSAINKQYPNLYWKHSPLQPVLIHIFESILTLSISVCLHLPTPGVSSSLDHQDHHLHSP